MSYIKKLFCTSINPKYHQVYNNIISGKPEFKGVKVYYQKLYEYYYEHQCEERNFLDGVKKQWYPRIWEMYITCQLIELGFNIDCLKSSAPDIKLTTKDNKIIWIECTTISKGEKAVVECVDNTVHELNDEDYILRITSTLSDKYKQIQRHKKSGVIGKSDIVLIAINTGELMLTNIAQLDYSLIHKALYGVGPQVYNFTLEREEDSQRFEIQKSKDASISSNLFTTADYKDISGVIFSNWQTSEIQKKLPDDFELTHNLFAKNKLPKSTFNIGIEFIPCQDTKKSGHFEKINHGEKKIR